MDLNPLHMIDELNNAIGKDTASVLEFLHLTDPAVKPDGVREVAKKWQALAKSVDDAQHQANTALKDVVWEGKAADAFQHRTQKVQNQAGQISGALRKGAAAVSSFADEAENLIDQIGKIAAELIEFEAAGLALSVLTAGFSEAASTIAAGERAMKIASLIERIEESGSVLGRAIKAVTEAIRGLRRVLEALKDIKAIASVAKMAGEGMKFTAFTTLLEDPSAFTDPGKLTDILAEGAIAGIGFGALGKAFGKGLKALSPVALKGLSKALCKLDDLLPERSFLRPNGEDGVTASIANTLKRFKQDPIDVVTGDMLLTQTDAHLPGVLPLVLGRTHLSSYRYGGWFGPSWASTVDQRLQLDDTGVVFATADGLRLCYPIPRPGTQTFPERGPHWPLTWDGRHGGRIHISDPATGRTYVFAHPTATEEARAVDLPLKAIEDRNGNRIEILYSVGDVPVEVRHHGGYRIALDHHDHLPRITALRLLDTDGPGTHTTLVRYGYDQSGNLTEITNSSGLPLRLTYDHAGRITSWADRNGTSYTYTYDERGRCVRGQGSDGYQSGTFAYDDANRTTTLTNSLGHSSTYVYNEAFRLIQDINPLGHATLTEWDQDNERITAVTDALGCTSRYIHDMNGNLAAIERPDGTAARAVYNSLGLPIELVEPDGQVWRHAYDERGNLLTTTDPAGARTTYEYDASGSLTAITDALGHTRTVTNDAAGLPVELTDALGNTTSIQRDGFGRITQLADALGNVTAFGWTIEGKPAWRRLPDGTCERWEWDGEGNLVAHTDGAGHATSYSITHFDLVASRTTSGGDTYSFTYDTELNLTKVTNPLGLTWEYGYDRAGRLVGEKDFNGRRLTYSHDGAGRLTASSNGMGERTRFTRDDLGRVIEQTSGDEKTTFAYAPSGRLVTAVNTHARTTCDYDAAGRLIAETVNGHRISYSYDALGRCVERRTPEGVISAWTYDAAGSPDTLTVAGHQTQFSFDAIGRETIRRFGADITLTQTWDRISRLTSQTLSRGPDTAPLQQRQYIYRADDYLAELRELTTGSRTFELDTRGRVTAVQARDWRETYAYDRHGNLAQAHTPLTRPEETTREYAGTRLRRAGRTTYEHDAQGRIVRTIRHLLNGQRRVQTYTWDAQDQLVETVTPDGTRWCYRYDHVGRRLAKQRLTSDGLIAEETTFSWAGTRLAEQTVNGSRSTTWEYTPGSHKPLAQVDRDLTQTEVDTRFHAIITDLVGTPAELLSAEGELAWHQRTTLWGLTASATGPQSIDCPLRFPGQYADGETGWNYNYFRHYDPEAAQYAAPDPLGLDPAPNHHSYVDNPLSIADPLGLAPCGPEGSTWTPDENYSPDAVSRRSAANKAFYQDTPQDIHDLVDRVVSDPSYPQRMTGPAGHRVPDIYQAAGAPRAAQRWRGSKIYDNGDPLSQARIIVDDQGNIAYVGRTKSGAHNYNQIIPYPWAKVP